MMKGLTDYKKKRNFKRTPEPQAEVKAPATKRIFVVQRHKASTLHYDFRIEVNGVLKSWAIPKGPSMNPHDRRLAIMVEDHPVSYASFKGTIPEGNYGAGIVEIWDKGTYVPNRIDPLQSTDRHILKQINEGSFKFTLKGKKLKGTFWLLRLKEHGTNSWILIKGNDRYAVEHIYNSEDYTAATSPINKLLRQNGNHAPS